MSAASQSARRSDEIRRRRMAGAHAAAKPAARSSSGLFSKLIRRPDARRRVVSGPAMPPVVVRRDPAIGASGSVSPRKRSSRRLYNVSLGSQGAEMRLPSLPRLGFSWRAISFILLAGMAAVLYYLWTAPEFQVSAAKISGLQRVTKADVNRALALRGAPVFTLDAEQIEQELLKDFSEFSAVEAVIELPNTLLITVTERTPVMVWQQNDRSILVDDQGKTLPARDTTVLDALPVIKAAGDPPPLPGEVSLLEETPLPTANLAEEISKDVVQEFIPTALFQPETVEAILKLAAQAPQGAQLIYEPAHGFGWQDARGWVVYFGDLSELDVKLNEYRAILEHIKASGGKPALVSVEFVHAPYFRLEE